MKKFIFKILFFSFPIVLFMFLADFFISNNLKKSNESPGELEVWNDIYSGNINSDIVIYGSSRAWVHIDPSILEDSLNLKTYNFGIDGHNFWLQYLRHKEYLKFNKAPNLIIVSVDIFSLQKREDLYNSEQFLPYMLWNNDINKFTSSYNGFTYKDYYFPLLRFTGNIKKIKHILKWDQKIGNKYRYKGFKGMEREWNSDLAKAKLKIPQYEISIDSSSVNLFNQFLFECKSKDIKVILVYTPEYIDGQNFIKNRNEIINKYYGFANKYNLLFLDYSNDILCKQKKYFYNSSHLNKKGAEVFTRRLSYDLKVHAFSNSNRRSLNNYKQKN
jgi:hypothetical protein